MKRFEDVVNSDFMDKYLPEIKPEYQVIDEDGKVNFGVLEKLFFTMHGDEYPNRFIYSLIHGMWSLMPSWNVPTKFRGNEDGIYKYCLDRGTTWQDVFGNEVSEDVLL